MSLFINDMDLGCVRRAIGIPCDLVEIKQDRGEEKTTGYKRMKRIFANKKDELSHIIDKLNRNRVRVLPKL